MCFRRRAVAYMTLANALHFGAYELARSAIMALFTSDTVAGFRSTAAVTLATGLVSPFSVLLLYAHCRVFDAYGPRQSLLYTTIAYALSMSTTAVILQWCSSRENSLGDDQWSRQRRVIAQVSIVFLFVAKNAFVQLLSAQHWSFLTSVLIPLSKKNTAARDNSPWTTVIAGIGSIVATLSGWLVSPLVGALGRQNKGPNNGLTGLLLVAAAVMVVTAYCSDEAYRIAQVNKFAPTGKAMERDAASKAAETDGTSNGAKDDLPPLSSSLLQRAKQLFQRLPVLQALCFEVVIYQSISSFLSYLFVSYSKAAMRVDEERARYTGNVYARINLGSGILQFAILPLLLGSLGHATRHLWLVMPGVVAISALWITVVPSTSMDVMTISFCVVKILEYSLRGALTERVYGSLDDEGRFFGKEIICMFANRFGKSATALCLAFLTATFPSFLGEAPFVLACGSALWLCASFRLVRLLIIPKHKVE